MRRRVIRLAQTEHVLRDHVAEHLKGAAVDPDQRREAVHVLRRAVVGRAVGAVRQRRRRAEDVHQVRRDVTHRLCQRYPTEDARRAERRLHPCGAATQPVCHGLVVDEPAPVRIPLRNLASGLVQGIGHEAGLVHHDRHVLQPIPRRGNCAVLGVERLSQHRPARVDLAEPVLVVDAYIAVIDDIGAIAVDGAHALDLDARGIERHQKHGQALVLCRLRIGVGDQKDVLTLVRAGSEHLRAVDDPAVPVAHRARLAGGDIGTAFGFGVAQAQPDVSAENLRQHLIPHFR